MERARAFNAAARAVLAPRGWIELDLHALSMGLTYDTAGQHDGMHMLGLPMKAAARAVAGAMCDEAMTVTTTTTSSSRNSTQDTTAAADR